MSLNDIQLSPSLAAALYRSSLINDDSATLIQKKNEDKPVMQPSWKFLGSNEKNILVVVNYNDTTHLPDEELSFLTNILSACKLTLGDVAIVNMNNYSGHTYKDFTDHFKSRIVLLFGVAPTDLGLPIDFPYFQVQSFSNQTFLYSSAMEERHHDELYKSKLWVSLRRVFGI